MRRIQQIASGFLTLCAATAPHAQSPFDALKAYSATIEMTGGAAPASAGHGAMKIYRSGDNIRTDLPGGAGYNLLDVGTHTNYMVIGSMCMQMNTPQQETPLAHSADATIDRAPVGTESVDGHPCKVENVTITPHTGPRAGQPTTMKVWEADDLHGFPIKMETQTSRGPMSIQYKDINLSAPDASLFVHPSNCSSMPMMPGMPGMSGTPVAPH